MEGGDSSSEKLHQRKLQEHITRRLDSSNLLGLLRQTNSVRLQVAKRNFDPKHIEAMTQYLRSQSTLLELVAIQLSQQLIKIYGQELDQKITSEIILIHIKNSVKEIFERNNIWQEVSKEIWSNLISRSIQDMQRDLGELVLESLDLAGFNGVLFQYLFNQESTLFINRINHLEAFYAQTIAAEIVQELDIKNQPQSALSKLLGVKSNNVQQPFVSLDKPSQLQQVVKSSIKPVSERTSQHASTRISAQLQADLQQPGAEGIAYARYHAKNNQDNSLEHYITSSGDLEVLPWESAGQIINKLGLDAAKLHFLLAAHAVRQAHPWESAFTLKASDVITELGWNKNGNSDLPTRYRQVADTANALSSLLLKVTWIEAEVENQTDTSTLVGRVWETLIHPHGQLNWKTGKIEKPEEVYITIRPGLGTIYFLNQANSQARKTLYQFGSLAGNLLQLDPYDNELALRLMIHLTLDARTRASDPNPYEYQVELILAALLPEDVFQHLRERGENARPLFDSWTHALNLLSQLGWHSEGNTLLGAEADQTPVFYVRPHPRWLEPESSFRKPRGWVEYWLEQRLIIKSPIPEPEWITALIRSNQAQQPTLQTICSSNLSGAEVRAARQAKKLTQTELANFLQVHQSLIARIESGDRTITPTLEASLRQILELECQE